MSAGDVTPGRRVENVGVLYDAEQRQPGDYVLVTSDDPEAIASGGVTLWFVDPSGHVGRVSKHTITEHDDGTVTVSPSILATTADHGHDWHGYLERGVWREV